jgi:hypothetical protein
MKNKRGFITFFGMFFALTFLFVFTGGAQPLFPYSGEQPPKPGTHAPIITSTFAVEKGYYGYIWKIYLEAEDPDGDMLRIASVVDQVGAGHYPTDWIFLKSQYGKHFRGYIQWNTYSSQAGYLPEWTYLTLKVSVLDKAGNESNTVVFPFTFEFIKDAYKYGLPAPFDKGDLPKLGNVTIDLRNADDSYLADGSRFD